MTILVIADHSNSQLKSTTANTVAAARCIGGDIVVLVAGQNCLDAANQASHLDGITRVICIDNERLCNQLPETLSEAVLASIAKVGATHVLFSSATTAKAAMPRVAAKLGHSALTEIVEVVAQDTFKRFIYAGGVLATVRTKAAIVVASVRSTAFEPVAVVESSCEILMHDVALNSRAFAFVSVEENKSDRPDLLTAKRVVAGGRGLVDEAGFATLQTFADKIGAAIGSTRAVVDMGLVPNETQIGQTGKIVAPELYFAFGISGAIQHVAGMKDAKVIVAVNKDAEAPIFEMCDYYLVADAVEVIQELTAKL